jgi:hypothetical protein
LREYLLQPGASPFAVFFDVLSFRVKDIEKTEKEIPR